MTTQPCQPNSYRLAAPWRWPALHAATIGVACWLALFINLGGPKLWDRDEPRNAGCAREMLQRHDWIVPVFNGELRTHKPILLYWVMMGAYQTLGINEFSARFGSALAGTLSVLATYLAGKRLFGARTAWFASLILASALMFCVASRAATPDALLISCSTWALCSFVLAAFPREHAACSASVAPDTAWNLFPHSNRATWLIYGWMGLAVLAKGPIGVLLPSAVIGMYLLVARKASQGDRSSASMNRVVQLANTFAPRHLLATVGHMRILTGAAVVSLVALPWYSWVGWRTDGAWLAGFLWEHNLNRAASTMEGHSGPIYYYAVAILAGFFPWSIFVLPVSLHVWRTLKTDTTKRPQLVLLLCWIGVYVGLFSLARTKLPSYVTPTYPALALLTAWFLDQWLQGRALVSRGWITAAYAVLAVVGTALLVGLPIAARIYLPSEAWLGLVGCVPLAAGLAGWWLARSDRAAPALGITLASAVATVALGFGWIAVRVSSHQRYEQFISAVRWPAQVDGMHVRPESIQLLAYRVLEPSWVYYAGQPIEHVTSDERDELPRLLGQNATAYLIVTRDDWQRLSHELSWPAPVAVLAEAPYFLRDEDLLLVGAAPQVARRQAP